MCVCVIFSRVGFRLKGYVRLRVLFAGIYLWRMACLIVGRFFVFSEVSCYRNIVENVFLRKFL